MWNKQEDLIQFNSDKDKAIHHWVSFPFIERPKHSVAVCLIIILMAYILWELAIVSWDQPLYYILGILMLCGGLMPYFVPTEYYFFEEHFLVQYPFVKIEKLYREYGCFYADKMGIMLSTFTSPRRLDKFRGQSIRFSKTQEERKIIIEFLKEKIGKQY